MYQIGERIIYGSTGVCEIKEIGPLEIQGAKKGVDYYTLSPVFQEGRIFAPVDSSVYIRPVLTRDEALNLIRQIPDINEDIPDDSNPRMLNDYYRVCLKSGDCLDLVRLVRVIYAKEKRAEKKGRHLGQVDERSMKRAEEMLHNELACALGIKPDDVRGFITEMLEP